MTLSYLDRPQYVKEKIESAFNVLAKEKYSNWGLYNGDYGDYHICDTNSFAIISNIVKTHPEKKEFYIMDVGAGDYGFSKEMAKLINQSEFSNIKFHLVGVRGEGNKDVEVYEDGICKVYNFGKFQIENIKDGLSQRGLGDVKFDYVISSWTLRHLVDPVGTVMQIHEMLSSEDNTGYFIFDGFTFEFYSEKECLDGKEHIYDKCANKDYNDYNDAMGKLAYAMREPFFYCSDVTYHLNKFVIKHTQGFLDLPFKYSGWYEEQGTQTGVTLKFELEDQALSKLETRSYDDEGEWSNIYLMRGDENLFNYFQHNELFQDTSHEEHMKACYRRYDGPLVKESMVTEQPLFLLDVIYNYFIPQDWH